MLFKAVEIRDMLDYISDSRLEQVSATKWEHRDAGGETLYRDVVFEDTTTKQLYVYVDTERGEWRGIGMYKDEELIECAPEVQS